MKQEVITENISSSVEAKFKEAIKDVKLDIESIDNYKTSRGIVDELTFHTETIEDIAYSFLDAVDLLRFLAIHNSSQKIVAILQTLYPTKPVEREIREFEQARFKELHYEQLKEAIEPIEEFLVTVINWIASQAHSDDYEKDDDDSDDSEEE